MNRWISHAKVILLCVFAAVAYGIVHDQITARLCIEYFTVGHPPLVHTTSPTLIGLAWGVAATFWVGLILGIPLAVASQSPLSLPPVPIPKIRKAVLRLLGIMALSAGLAGIVGFQLFQHGHLTMPDCWVEDIPASHHARFMAAWFAHAASYLSGLLGGVCIIFLTWNQRGRPAAMAIFPRTGPAALRAMLIFASAGVIIWLRFFRP